MSQSSFPEPQPVDLSAPLFRSSYKTCGPLMSKAAPRIRFG